MPSDEKKGGAIERQDEKRNIICKRSVSVISIERAFVGILLSDSKYINQYLSLESNAIVDEELRKIFVEMKHQFTANKTYDIVTITEKNISKESLTSLLEYKKYSKSLNIYAREIIERSVTNKILAVTTELREKLIDSEEAHNKIKNIVITSADEKEYYTSTEAIQSWVSHSGTRRLNSNIEMINDEMGWPAEAAYIIIAARPSQGKTTMMINIAEHLRQKGAIGGEFSAEMSVRQNMDVRISLRSRVNNIAIRNREKLKNALAIEKIDVALQEMSKEKYYINDIANIDINRLTSIAHKMTDVNFLCIDYIQLITARHMQSSRRHEQLSHISMELKQLARDKNIPIFVLAQLNRDADGREPRISDLKDCGQIEQDADMIILINASEEERQKDNPNVDIILAKNRFGATGRTKMLFEKEYSRFKNLTKVDYIM